MVRTELALRSNVGISPISSSGSKAIGSPGRVLSQTRDIFYFILIRKGFGGGHVKAKGILTDEVTKILVICGISHRKRMSKSCHLVANCIGFTEDMTHLNHLETREESPGNARG